MEFVIKEFVIKEFIVDEFAIMELAIREFAIREFVIRESLNNPPAINLLNYYDWMWKLIVRLVAREGNMELIKYETLKQEEDKTVRYPHLEWETMVILDPNFMDFSWIPII